MNDTFIRTSPIGRRVEQRPAGLYLIDDDWEVARRFVEEGEGLPTRVTNNENGYKVEIGYGPGEFSAAEWGADADYETAWRYALGAHYGSYDDPVDNPWVERYEGPTTWIGESFIDVRDVDEHLLDVDEDEDDEALEAQYIKRVLEAQSSLDWDWLCTNEPLLIHESHFEDYAQQLAEDTGAIDRDATWPANRINWAEAADDLRIDYTDYLIDGHTYYGRA